tara:strand:+ start:10191 stop:10706 length:516 start_codon:yes stop_codon:yes gene_type:complete
LQSASTQINELYKQQKIQDTKQVDQESSGLASPNDAATLRHPDVPKSHDKVGTAEGRKLFKKIATKIHPDKLHHKQDDHQKQKELEMYSAASSALENNDLVILFEIANDLGLKFEMTEDVIKQTEEKIKNIKKEIEDIEKTFAWKWFFSDNELTRQRILNKLFRILDEQKK